MPTSHSVHSLLDNLVHGWGEKYGHILDGLGLNNLNDLADLSDEEVKEVLVEHLQVAGAPTLHIVRIVKSLNQHRLSAVTDQNRLSTVTEHVNRPRTMTNLEAVDGVTILNNDVDDSVTSIASENDAITQSVHPCKLGIKRGDVFANTATLGAKISQYAMEHNFHVRREKHAIVCSNSGHTTWTAVNDVEGRAKQKLRKLKKKHVDEGDLEFADTGQDWRDLVQCEEEEVRGILQSMYFFLTLKFVFICLFHFRQNSKKRVLSHPLNVDVIGKFVSPKKRVKPKLK